MTHRMIVDISGMPLRGSVAGIEEGRGDSQDKHHDSGSFELSSSWLAVGTTDFCGLDPKDSLPESIVFRDLSLIRARMTIFLRKDTGETTADDKSNRQNCGKELEYLSKTHLF